MRGGKKGEMEEGRRRGGEEGGGEEGGRLLKGICGGYVKGWRSYTPRKGVGDLRKQVSNFWLAYTGHIRCMTHE